MTESPGCTKKDLLPFSVEVVIAELQSKNAFSEGSVRTYAFAAQRPGTSMALPPRKMRGSRACGIYPNDVEHAQLFRNSRYTLVLNEDERYRMPKSPVLVSCRPIEYVLKMPTG